MDQCIAIIVGSQLMLVVFISDCSAVIHSNYHIVVLIACLRRVDGYQSTFARLLALQLLLCRQVLTTALMIVMAL